MNKMKVAMAAVAIVVGGLVLPGAALAPGDADQLVGDETAIPAPLPATMTDEEMDAISSDGVIEFTNDATEPRDSVSGNVSPYSVPISVPGEFCKLDPGIMWQRSSGAGHPYGTVGSKPRLYDCTLGVRETGMSSEVWMHNGWVWFRAAGPFNSHGTGNMQQKKVAYICKGTGKYSFKVITTAWGTNGAGKTGSGRDSTGEYQFYCG